MSASTKTQQKDELLQAVALPLCVDVLKSLDINVLKSLVSVFEDDEDWDGEDWDDDGGDDEDVDDDGGDVTIYDLCSRFKEEIAARRSENCWFREIHPSDISDYDICNHVRHTCTHYDEICSYVHGMVGGPAAYRAVKYYLSQAICDRLNLLDDHLLFGPDDILNLDYDIDDDCDIDFETWTDEEISDALMRREDELNAEAKVMLPRLRAYVDELCEAVKAGKMTLNEIEEKWEQISQGNENP